MEKYTSIIYDKYGKEKIRFEDCYLRHHKEDLFFSFLNEYEFSYRLDVGESIKLTLPINKFRGFYFLLLASSIKFFKT